MPTHLKKYLKIKPQKATFSASKNSTSTSQRKTKKRRSKPDEKIEKDPVIIFPKPIVSNLGNDKFRLKNGAKAQDLDPGVNLFFKTQAGLLIPCSLEESIDLGHHKTNKQQFGYFVFGINQESLENQPQSENIRISKIKNIKNTITQISAQVGDQIDNGESPNSEDPSPEGQEERPSEGASQEGEGFSPEDTSPEDQEDNSHENSELTLELSKTQQSLIKRGYNLEYLKKMEITKNQNGVFFGWDRFFNTQQKPIDTDLIARGVNHFAESRKALVENKIDKWAQGGVVVRPILNNEFLYELIIQTDFGQVRVLFHQEEREVGNILLEYEFFDCEQGHKNYLGRLARGLLIDASFVLDPKLGIQKPKEGCAETKKLIAHAQEIIKSGKGSLHVGLLHPQTGMIASETEKPVKDIEDDAMIILRGATVKHYQEEIFNLGDPEARQDMPEADYDRLDQFLQDPYHRFCFYRRIRSTLQEAKNDENQSLEPLFKNGTKETRSPFANGLKKIIIDLCDQKNIDELIAYDKSTSWDALRSLPNFETLNETIDLIFRAIKENKIHLTCSETIALTKENIEAHRPNLKN